MIRILDANRFVSKGDTKRKGLRKGSTTVTAKRRHTGRHTAKRPRRFHDRRSLAWHEREA